MQKPVGGCPWAYSELKFLFIVEIRGAIDKNRIVVPHVRTLFCEVFLSSHCIFQSVVPVLKAGETENRFQSKGKGKLDRAKVVKEELFEQDTRFLAVYVETTNSCVIMLSEKEDKLGTMAVAVPKPRDLLGPVSSSVLLGDKNAVSARMFAEYVASKKGKIAMVSVYLDKLSEMQAQAFFMHLLEKVLRAESGKEAATT
jgi:hypothetical protein